MNLRPSGYQTDRPPLNLKCYKHCLFDQKSTRSCISYRSDSSIGLSLSLMMIKSVNTDLGKTPQASNEHLIESVKEFLRTQKNLRAHVYSANSSSDGIIMANNFYLRREASFCQIDPIKIQRWIMDCQLPDNYQLRS